MKRILVVEDETFALEDLKESLLRVAPSLNIVTARSGTEALERLQTQRFDALFLDIELPGIGGLELIRQLGKSAPPTVLVTGHLREAIEAFGLGIVECLLKPVDDAKLREIVAKLRGGQAPSFLEKPDGAARPRWFLLGDGRRFWVVGAGEIFRFVREEAGSRGYFAGGTGVVAHDLDRMESLLDPGLFARVSNDAILAFASMESVLRGLDDRLTIYCKDGSEFPVDPAREEAFLAGFES